MKKAEELESSLESDYPSFVKSMLPSHVTGGFWLVSISRLLYSVFVVNIFKYIPFRLGCSNA